MNKKSYSDVFDAAVRKHVPDNVDLAPRILSHIQKGKGVSMNTKLTMLATALTIMAAFTVILFNGPTVAHALEEFFGYIPGLGTVDSGGSLRVLAEPASVTKDGVTVTIDKGSVDSEKTILTMVVTGLTSTQFNDCMFTGSDITPSWLRLPDGTKLKSSTFNGTGPSRADVRYYFPALPPGSNDVTLEIPCLMVKPSPTDWEIPLHFEEATGLKPFPVIEISSSTPGAETSAQSPYGILLTLEQVAPVDDGYILMGNLKWSNPGIVLANYDSIRVVDAAGHELATSFVLPDATDPDYQTRKKAPWALKVSGKEHAWPLTLSVTNVQVNYNGLGTTGYSAFSFDMGQSPQVGQTWSLNQDVKNYVTPSYTVHLNSAALIADPASGQPGIVFDVQTDPDITDLMLEDLKSDGSFRGLSSEVVQPGHMSIGFVFLDGVPSGKRMFAFTEIIVLAHGNWQVTWQP